MSELRKEIHERIDTMSDTKLEALKPLLTILSDDVDFAIETDLTDEEKAIIAKARAEYKPEDYIPLSKIDWT